MRSSQWCFGQPDCCGGLRNATSFRWIYADVTGREFRIAASQQTPALGSAMFGAVAAGKAAGGYDSITEASQRMARLRDEKYEVTDENHAVYEQLYGQYVRLHDLFGRGSQRCNESSKEN